jgi:hypothetical protein
MVALFALPTPIGSPHKASAAGEPVLQYTRLSIIDYKTIFLTYSKRLYPTYPTSSLFEVKADGVVVSIASVNMGYSEVEVLLTSVVTAGQRLTISYLATAPVAGTSNAAVQDSAGNDAAAFTDELINHSSNISALPTPAAPTIVAGPRKRYCINCCSNFWWTARAIPRLCQSRKWSMRYHRRLWIMRYFKSHSRRRIQIFSHCIR